MGPPGPLGFHYGCIQGFDTGITGVPGIRHLAVVPPKIALVLHRTEVLIYPTNKFSPTDHLTDKPSKLCIGISLRSAACRVRSTNSLGVIKPKLSIGLKTL